MAYDLHIVRTRNWLEASSAPITKEDVDALVASDPELAWSATAYVDMGEEAGAVTRYWMIAWRGQPCFWWYRDEIRCSGPDEAQVLKLVQMARALNALCVGDDDEVYDDTTAAQTSVPSPWRSTSFPACILSLIALAMLLIVIPLDSFIRQDHPVGTPVPLKWAIVLAIPGIVGVLSWLISILFAIAAFLLRQPSMRYAIFAIVINSATGAYVAIEMKNSQSLDRSGRSIRIEWKRANTPSRVRTAHSGAWSLSSC